MGLKECFIVLVASVRASRMLPNGGKGSKERAKVRETETEGNSVPEGK